MKTSTKEATTTKTTVDNSVKAPLFGDFELMEFTVKPRGGKGRNWGEIKPTITYLSKVDSWQLNKVAKEKLKVGTYRCAWSKATNQIALIWMNEGKQYRILAGDSIFEAKGLKEGNNMKVTLQFDELPDVENLKCMGPIEVTTVVPRASKVTTEEAKEGEATDEPEDE